MCYMLIYHTYVCVLDINCVIIFLLFSKENILHEELAWSAPSACSHKPLHSLGLSSRIKFMFCIAVGWFSLLLAHCEFCEGQGLCICSGEDYSVHCPCCLTPCCEFALQTSIWTAEAELASALSSGECCPLHSDHGASISINPPLLPRSSGDSSDKSVHRYSSLKQVSWQQRWGQQFLEHNSL